MVSAWFSSDTCRCNIGSLLSHISVGLPYLSLILWKYFQFIKAYLRIKTRRLLNFGVSASLILRWLRRSPLVSILIQIELKVLEILYWLLLLLIVLMSLLALLVFAYGQLLILLFNIATFAIVLAQSALLHFLSYFFYHTPLSTSLFMQSAQVLIILSISRHFHVLILILIGLIVLLA